MAAVIDLHTGQHLPDALPQPRSRRPELTLVQGGRTSSQAGSRASLAAVPGPRTYLVRRVVAVAIVAVALLAAAQVLGRLTSSVVEALDRPPAASGRTHVVEPGDTAWNLAARLAPGVDRRTAVDDLLALNGDSVLQVGEQLRLPASFG